MFQLFGGKSRFKGCAFLNNVAVRNIVHLTIVLFARICALATHSCFQRRQSDGGAMRIQDGIVEIDGCLFQYNSAEDVSFTSRYRC